MMTIEIFVHQLALYEFTTPVFNQYSYHVAANAVRRENLTRYLYEMQQRQPTILLVGEAPGYNGCRRTGVPFTSEYLLLNGIPQFNLFGRHNGYQKSAEFADISREQTATIIWQTLMRHDVVPLCWNALPFHPFQAGKPRSNRMPTPAELLLGGTVLRDLLDLFAPQTIVAVGKQAAATLARLSVPAQQVRHPANGGKVQFVAGLERIIEARTILPS